MKIFPRKSQFPPRAPQNGRFTKNNNQCAIQQRTITLNTKLTNDKEKIHEFNFKAAKNKIFDLKNSRLLALCENHSNYTNTAGCGKNIHIYVVHLQLAPSILPTLK
jgi:hypothetical protein